MTPYFDRTIAQIRKFYFHVIGTWWSVWSRSFPIIACNLLYKFIQILSRASWLIVLIVVVIIGFGWEKIKEKVWYTWSFTYPQRKSPVRLSHVILLASMLDHILQSVNLETFHPKITADPNIVRSSPILLEKCILWKLSSSWADMSVQYLISIDFLDCFMNKRQRNCHTIGVDSPPDCHTFAG